MYSLGRAIMAQAPTIPVRTREDYGYREKGEVVQLGYDTSVIVATGLPAVGDIEIRPCRMEFRPDKHPSRYEIRYVKDLQWSFYRLLSPARKERRPSSWGTRRRLAGKNFDGPHPDAGKVLTRVSPLLLHRVQVGVRVYFPRNGGWDQGRVEDYVHVFDAKRAMVKAKTKAEDKKRKRSRYPSVWDRLNSDD